MNTAHDLLQQARAAGYILTPKEGGLIEVVAEVRDLTNKSPAPNAHQH